MRPRVAARRVVDRLRGTDPRVVDGLLAVALSALALVSVLMKDTTADYDFKDPTPFVALLAVAGSAPLLWRRTRPLGVHLPAVAVPTALGLADYDVGTTPVTVLVTTYGLAVYAARWRGALGLGLLGVALVALAFGGAAGFEDSDGVFTAVTYVAVWFFGYGVRQRRLRLETAEERARLLEREQAEGARRAVAEERLRLAQDLHDVVAHAMSVITVQSGVAAHVMDRDTEAARRALGAIEDTSRAALDEMRRMLGVLRTEGSARGSLAPTPTLADLDALVARFRAAGLPVVLERAEDPGVVVPDSVQLTAFRLVQESLTNVLKHAGAATARVGVVTGPHDVRVEVTDDGRGAAAVARGETGHGLAGMRERVSLFGGSLEAGPRPGGGYRVRARLPLGAPVPGQDRGPSVAVGPTDDTAGVEVP